MRGVFGVLLRWREASIVFVAIALAVYFDRAANSNFLLTGASLQNLSQFIAPVAILACGEVMLMIGGEIDLVRRLMGLCARTLS